MQLLLGKPIAEQVLSRVRERIRSQDGIPGLAVIMVGRDPASEIYVGLKERAAQSVGMHFEKHALPTTAKTETVQQLVRDLNGRTDIHGIIVQLPLPAHIATDAVIATLQPEKDADGFHPQTVARFLAGDLVVPPVFPRAIRTLIRSTSEPLAGKRAIILANSSLFVQVMVVTLNALGIVSEDSLTLGAGVTIARLRESEIIVSAQGKPASLVGSLVRPGTIVIDGGITRVGDQICGDADPASFAAVEGYIAPVPGGVGPVTVALLIARVAELALGGQPDEGIL